MKLDVVGDIHGQYDKLVGLLAQPEGLFTTAAQALDYQFGFKVSETWFFRLLQQNLPFLVLAQLAVLFLSTCVVFIDAGEQAVLERFGKPVGVLVALFLLVPVAAAAAKLSSARPAWEHVA